MGTLASEEYVRDQLEKRHFLNKETRLGLIAS